MSDLIEKIPDPSFAEKFWLFLFTIGVFFSRAFFLDMGFGCFDAWRVGFTGKFWALTGEYTPSRPPGFPLTESVAALGYSLFRDSPGTWIFTNGLTALVFCISVWGVWVLAKKWNAKPAFLIAAIYAFAPLNWVYSVETIDYLWTTSFLVFSVLALESGKRSSVLWAGILLGVATSARFFAGFQIIPFLILAWRKNRSVKDLWTFFIAFAVVSLGSYAIVLKQVGDWTEYINYFHELNKVSSGMAEQGHGQFVARFLMPAASLFGPFATFGLLIAGLIGLPKFIKNIRDRDEGTLGAALMAAFIMAPYLLYLRQNYWIPAIAFLLILLARSINPKLLAIAGILIIMANFPWWQTNIEGLRLLSPDASNRKIEAYAQRLAPYQNETVFNEMKLRQFIFGTVEELTSKDLPTNWIIMAGSQIPICKYLTPGIERIDLPLINGGSIGAWGNPGHGARYGYLFSPEQVQILVESGYHAVYLPGMEKVYQAAYGVPITEVEGVMILNEN
ncbi:MAG: glycosyltransferase family 39 protein [bacterium]|nr:glycosyltransferase family 39 protein [bacterium]